MTKEDDKQLFEQAMKGVRKLNHSNTKPSAHALTSAQKKIRQQNAEGDREVTAASSRQTYEWHAATNFEYKDQDEITTNTQLQFMRSGVSPKSFKKLKAGKLSCEAELDLHGFTRPQAAQILDKWINDCQASGIKSARIVHGRGRDINQASPLKTLVYHGLKADSRMLAFCSAQPKHGGLGAVYVLFRRGQSDD